MTLSRVESRKQQIEAQRGGKKKGKSVIIVLAVVAILFIGCAVAFQYERITGMIASISSKFNKETQPIYSVVDSHPLDKESDLDSTFDGAAGITDDDTESEQQIIEKTVDDEEAASSSDGNDGGGVFGSIGSEGSQEPAVSTAEEDYNATIQLAFVGDILQGEYIDGYLQQEGYNYPFEQALFHLTSADITAGNLEMPITTHDEPAEEKQYLFRGKPEALSGLVDAGIDVVSLANNHTLDHGITGLLDTRKHLDEYGIAHVGAGSNAEEAYSPVILEANGIKVAYVGTSRVLPDTAWKATPYQAGLAESYSPEQTLKAIEEVEEEAHITVVLVHWGIERADTPDENQLRLAKSYIDAGADLVIGSHPHVLQGFEQYNGKWIAYSLGNFVFAAHPKGKQAETGVLTATCNAKAECEAQFAPMTTINAQPTPVDGETATRIIDYLEVVSRGVKLDERGNLSLAR